MTEYRLQIDFDSRTVYLLESVGDRPTITSVSFRTIPLQDALRIVTSNFCSWLLRRAGQL